MTTRCPKCQHDNPTDTVYCGKCATPLKLSKEGFVPTQTFETSKEELTTGSTFAGRYQIIEELGKGGMGKVYKAHDTKIKEKIALKLIKPEIAKDKKTIERFSNELRLARKIRHKNICQMFDLGEEKESHFITMEFVPGEDLKSMIRMSGRLAVGTTISIAKQVCEGLSEAHKLGIIHRDLKPSNIMIDREGSARIMDFGIARSLESKGITGAGVMIGTPEYMSPEQVEGKEVDQRSDIYSLGVILYEMVTGQVPFAGDTPFTVGVKHKSEMPQDPKALNPQIPDDLSRVILQCLEKEKDGRYQSTGEVRSELILIEKGMPTTERKIPVSKPLTSKEITVTFNVKKFFLPVGAVLILVVAALVLWQVMFKKDAFVPPEEKHTLAVISFENQTGDKAYDYLQKAIPNLLITSLEQSKYIQVTTWERMHDLLKQMGKEDAEIIDRDLGFELCEKDEVDAIVLGSFIKAGETFATDIKVLEVGSKKLLKSASSRGEGVASILNSQIDELSRHISRGIGLTERKIQSQQKSVIDVTTSSMEAYELYLKGREEQRKWNDDDARKYYEKALELDPTFTSAWHRLAYTYRELGNIKDSIEAYSKAKLYADKATDIGKLWIEASYARYVEDNRAKQIRLYEEILKINPKNKSALYQVAFYTSDIHERIEKYQKVLELDPEYGGAWNQLGYDYVELGDFNNALECFTRYKEVLPGSANPFDSMAELYFWMGRLDEAVAEYQQALEMKPDFFDSYWRIGYIYALKENYTETLSWINKFSDIAPTEGVRAHGEYWKGYFHFILGRDLQALREFEESIKISEAVGSNLKYQVLNTLGWIHLTQGDYVASRRAFDDWWDHWKDNKETPFAFKALRALHLGFLGAKKRDLENAGSHLEMLRQLLPDVEVQRYYMNFVYVLLRAEILLADNKAAEIIAFFEKEGHAKKPRKTIGYMWFNNMPFLRDVLARAYHQNGELDKAIAEYERIVSFDPDSDDRLLVYPLNYYRLAKLYQEKGWHGKAIENFEKFLDIWKDADLEITELKDARKNLAGLRSQ